MGDWPHYCFYAGMVKTLLIVILLVALLPSDFVLCRIPCPAPAAGTTCNHDGLLPAKATSLSSFKDCCYLAPAMPAALNSQRLSGAVSKSIAADAAILGPGILFLRSGFQSASVDTISPRAPAIFENASVLRI